MQNESLNGGGTLFVDKHPNLKVRVVHGNTCTAAVILNELPKDVKEVFLTGATSKLGRAIALYLCRKRVRVLVIANPLFLYFLFNKIFLNWRMLAINDDQDLCWLYGLKITTADADSINRKIPENSERSTYRLSKLPCSSDKIPSSSTLQGTACKLEFNFMKLDRVYINLIINVIELFIGFENRHGLLANGSHQGSKIGRHKERIFISLLCHQYCILEEIALTETLPPWDCLTMLKDLDFVR